MYKFDMHVHTNYSRCPENWGSRKLVYSQRGEPRKVILTAVKKGLDGIAVVDQNNLEGSIYVAKVCKGLKNIFKVPEEFQVIPGEEAITPRGEFIAIGHQEGIGPCHPESKDWKDFGIGDLCEAMDNALKQDGVILAEHPFFNYRTAFGSPLNLGENLYNPEVAKRVTAIEVYSSAAFSTKVIPGLGKNSSNAFEKAERFGKDNGLALTSGSDNHSDDWVGLACTMFEDPDIISGLRKRRAHVDRTEFESPSIYNYLTHLKFVSNPYHAEEFVKNIALSMKKKF